MPTPVSSTWIRRPDFATTHADTLTFPPAGVNLDGFDTRLNRT